MMTWFITALVNVALMGVVPPIGWIQGGQAFKDKEVCESMIPITAASIYMTVTQMTSGLGTVDDIVCMTEEDWLARNVELGHEVPPDLQLKTEPALPKGT
jgi:hypothetical protein